MKKIDFRNTIIIMTSNLGFSETMFHKNKIGYVNNQYNKEDVDIVISNHFRPEFLNRIDSIVNFDVLSEETCKQLAKDYLNEYARKVNYEIATIDEMVSEIAKDKESKNYGARGIKRLAKQKLIKQIKQNHKIKDNSRV